MGGAAACVGLLLAGCASQTAQPSSPTIDTGTSSHFVLPPQDSTGVGFQVGVQSGSSGLAQYKFVYDGPNGALLSLEAFKNASRFDTSDDLGGTTPLILTGDTAADLRVPPSWPQTIVSTKALGKVVITCMNGWNVLQASGNSHLGDPLGPTGATGFVDSEWTFSLSPPTDASTPTPASCQVTPTDIDTLTRAVEQLRIVDAGAWQDFLDSHRAENALTPPSTSPG